MAPNITLCIGLDQITRTKNGRVNSVAGRDRHLVPRPRPVACVVDAEEPRTLPTSHRGQGMATTQIPRFYLCGYCVVVWGPVLLSHADGF
jgi:hypothetical protein